MSVIIVDTGASNYSHKYDADGRLTFCSEAYDMGHVDEDGKRWPVGYGFCEHVDHDVDGIPNFIVVPVEEWQ